MESIGNQSKEVNLSKFATLQTSDKLEVLSDKYKFASTAEILNELAKHGWTATQYQEKATKSESRQGYQAHVAILQNVELNNALSVSGTLPRLVIKNSHDGKSALQFNTGLYEKICANGLVVGSETASCRLLHTQISENTISENLDYVIKQMVNALVFSEKMKKIKLDQEQVEGFLDEVVNMVWDGEKYTVKPKDLIRWHRTNQDPYSNLWNLYNVAQESVIKGGVSVLNNETREFRRSPAVRGIDRNLKLNKELWNLAEQVASLYN